jgi:hypothetical protein
MAINEEEVYFHTLDIIHIHSSLYTYRKESHTRKIIPNPYLLISLYNLTHPYSLAFTAIPLSTAILFCNTPPQVGA